MIRLRVVYFIWLSLLLTSVYSQQSLPLYNQAAEYKSSDLLSADSLIKLSIQKAGDEDNFQLLAKAYFLAANIQLALERQSNAEGYFNKAIQISTQHDFKNLKAKHLIKQGNYYLDKGDFSSAVKSALESAEIATIIKNDTIKTKAFAALAEMYRQYDHYELALEYNNKVIVLGKQLKNERLWSMSYNNLGATLGEVGRNYEAIDSLKRGLQLISSDNLFAKAKLNSNIGYCYRNLGLFDKAITFHRIALSLKRKAKLTKSIGYSLGAIGRAFLGKGNTDSAVYYTQQQYDLAVKHKVPHLIADAAAHLSEAFEAAGNYKQALILFKENKTIHDSIYIAEDEINALNFQRKFDLAQKQQELENEQSLQAAKNQVYLAILIALIIISILLALLFRAKIRQKDEENKRIEVELKNSKLAIEQGKNELQEFSKDIYLKNESIQDLTSKLEKTSDQLNAFQESKATNLQILNDFKILTSDDWLQFKLLFEEVYPRFFTQLNALPFKFTKGEKLLISLVKLDMSNTEMGRALGISPESVSKSKFRLKKKLDSNQISMGVEEFVHQF